VSNLFVCPICLCWLRGGGDVPLPADSDEEQDDPLQDRRTGRAARGAGGGAGPSSCHPCGTGGAGGSAGGVGAPPDLDAAFDPIATVYGAESVRAWHDQHGLPPEAAAAQCCFRKLADVAAHLTQYAGLGPSHAGTGRGRA
jgi:hypothetical protein